MSSSPHELGIDRLSVAERLDLIGQIWDTLPPDAELPIPDWHIRELERRLAVANADPGAALPRPGSTLLAQGVRPQVVKQTLTAIIEREGDGYVARCPDFDVVSQGDTIEAARQNLLEALELFFECASPEEVERRRSSEIYITQVEVALG
jgi:putative addiction module component (TIGR02574 family)